MLSTASCSGLVPWASVKNTGLEHRKKGSCSGEVISEKNLKQPQLFWPQTLASSVNE